MSHNTSQRKERTGREMASPSSSAAPLSAHSLYDRQTNKITIEEIFNFKIAYLKAKVVESSNKILEDASLFDLVLNGDEGQAESNEIYLFFDPSGQFP